MDVLKEQVVALGQNAKEARVLTARKQVQPFPADGPDVSDWKTNNVAYSKPDGSVVTKADIGVGLAIEELLGEQTPDIPVINEESPDAYALYQAACEKAEAEGKAGPTFWTIDPIDCTSNYATSDKGSNDYSVMLGLVENGKPVFGMNYYPELGAYENGMLVYTEKGKVMWGEFEEDGHYTESSIKKRPVTYGGGRGEILRVTPNMGRIIDASPELKQQYLGARQTEVSETEHPMHATLHLLQGKAQLGGHWGKAAVWDVVPYMALCNTQGVATVMLDRNMRNVDGSLNFSQLDENLKPGAYVEGTPDTLNALGLLSRSQYAHAIGAIGR